MTAARKRKNPLRLGVLASGFGSNFQAILDAIAGHHLDAEVAVLLVNNPEAKAIDRAEKAGIPVVLEDHRLTKDRDQYGEKLVQALVRAKVDLVVLAGFLRILPENFLQQFHQKTINIHPALLPAFPGLHVIEKAFDMGCKVTGVTVHFVDAGIDTGPIIAQRMVPILEKDTLETLAQRIHACEHALYPEVIQWFAEERVVVSNRRVHIKGND